jgi:S-formylglutathione hydrolase FrmB
MSLESNSVPQSEPRGRSEEFKPPHLMPADAVAKASVTTQVLPDRRATLRLMAPGARQLVERLDKLKIPSTYEEFAGGVHSWEVWRPSVNNFSATLFPPKY